MKPDWKTAPDWAQWLAMDSGGDWYWYEKEPSLRCGVWLMPRGSLFAMAGKSTITHPCEERPK